MSSYVGKCDFCQKEVTFDEEPYDDESVGTRYWRSVFTDKPETYLFQVERKVPTYEYYPNGDIKQIKIRTLKEFIFGLYCNAQCGLSHKEQK